MTFATGGRPGFLLLFFYHAAVAHGTTSVKGLAQSGFVPFLISSVAFFTALFFALRVNELAGVFVLIMMTRYTIVIRQNIRVNFMLIYHRRPSQFSEDLLVGQKIGFFLSQ
jgi:hypothetical protein